jgi:ribosome-binding ATPase YchF (GTP1/OBG family)
VEKRLERLEKDQKRGKKPNPEEIELLMRCRTILEQEIPLRKESELALSPLLRGFALLSAKPVLVLLNNPDDDPETPELPEQIARETCISIRGQLERELSQMDKEEAALFFEEYQIENTATDRIIRHSYAILGLNSFFTVGEDEVKAWTIKKDTLAVDAAGTIHSDMKKGFIRAEVLAYDDLKEAGFYKEARKRGTVRLEGKTYAVQDGDIINFRFNV